MSVTVVRRPIVSSGGNDFRFNSVGLPTIYEFQRRDFTFNQVNSNSGLAQLQFTGVDIASSFSVGDDIYIKSTNNSNYATVSKVSASVFSGGNTLVTTFATYNNSSQGYVNNETLRSGYYLQVRFYNTSNVLLTESILEISPNRDGTMLTDISEFAKSFLSPDFGSRAIGAFDIVDDVDASKAMYVGYREVWFGSQENETADSSNPITVVLGAQQLPLTNGSNYGVSVDRYTSDIDGTLKANWLRTSSVYSWRGWPFSISFLLNLDGEYDIYPTVNGDVNTGGLEGTLLTSNRNNLKTVRLGGMWGSYPNDKNITLKIINDATTSTVVKDINLSVQEPCKNPVMLLFRNHLGGDTWQMFDGAQEYGYEQDNGTKVKRMLLSVDGLTESRWNELNDMITYGAEIKENIVEILSTTNKTKRRAYQQVYSVAQDGAKTGVIVIPTSNNISNARLKHIFEVEIEFPEHFLP